MVFLAAAQGLVACTGLVGLLVGLVAALVGDLVVVLLHRQGPVHLLKVAAWAGMQQLALQVTLQLALSLQLGLAMALPI